MCLTNLTTNCEFNSNYLVSNLLEIRNFEYIDKSNVVSLSKFVKQYRLQEITKTFLEQSGKPKILA